METVGEVNANDCVTNCGPKLTPSVIESFETGGINEQVLNERDPSKDLKRKKNKKQGDVGLLGSGGYPSSNERPNKEPKLVVDDPFELEPVILGLDTSVVKTRGPPPVSMSNSFQVFSDENDEMVENVNSDSETPIEDGASTALVETGVEYEVASTKVLGVKLGVQLEGHEDLIKSSIQGK
ncbi:hypothetical protein Hanom_Chr07g00612251 [Helianthus anomalus]